MESSSRPAETEGEFVINLGWAAAQGATEYEIEVYLDPLLLVQFDSTLTDSTGYELTVPDVGVYYWRVRSIGSNENPGPWTDKQSVSIHVFSNYYGGSGNDNPHQIIASISGGSIVRATTTSPELTEGLEAEWIFKLDENGVMQWDYVSPLLSGATYLDMVEASDGNLYVVGYQFGNDVILKFCARWHAFVDQDYYHLSKPYSHSRGRGQNFCPWWR